MADTKDESERDDRSDTAPGDTLSADIEVTAAIVERAYEETMALLEGTRDFITHDQPLAEQGLSGDDRIRLSFMTMQITSKLTQAMAWLLAHKAVQGGEMPREELNSDRFRLNAASTPATIDDGQSQTAVPPRLVELHHAAHALYDRVDRLSAQIREAA